MSYIVGRDPFSRSGLAREVWGSGKCDWCGQHKKVLFQYAIETDEGRRPVLGQPVGASGAMIGFGFRTAYKFCNIQCFRSYSN